MRLLKTIVLLVAGVVHAGPALQHPLTLSPDTTLAPTRVSQADDPEETTTTTTSEEPPCSTPSLMSVTFNELAVTYYGEEIYLTGSISDLGEWNTGSALHLNSSEYTAEKPLWYVTVDLPVDATFEYKYFRKIFDGSITWESDPNRPFTVEGNCDGKVTQDDSWR